MPHFEHVGAQIGSRREHPRFRSRSSIPGEQHAKQHAAAHYGRPRPSTFSAYRGGPEVSAVRYRHGAARVA